jgi:hypothetical protein
MGTHFLKTYTTETLLCQMSGIKDRKTFRKWSWKFVDVIAMLEPIIVSNVFRANITCFVLTLYDLPHCLVVHFPIYLDPMGKSSKRRPRKNALLPWMVPGEANWDGHFRSRDIVTLVAIRRKCAGHI